jgi:hypothetical protein
MKSQHFTIMSQLKQSRLPGSGPFGAVAHIAWLGQPAQASTLPAASLSGPYILFISHETLQASIKDH